MDTDFLQHYHRCETDLRAFIGSVVRDVDAQEDLFQEVSQTLEFARIAKMDALLARRMPAAQARPWQRRNWRSIAVAAALVAVCGVVASRFLPRERFSSVGLAVQSQKRVVKPVTLAQAAATEERLPLRSVLSQFYIHLDVHGKRVSEVLAALPELIQATDLLRNPSLQQIRFTARAATGAGELDPVVRTASSPPSSVGKILEICALYRPVDTANAEETISYLGPVPHQAVPMTPSAEITTRVFAMPPDFPAYGYHVWTEFHSTAESAGAATHSTPLPGTPPGPQKRLDVHKLLAERVGITLGRDEDAKYLPGSGRIILKARQEKHALLEKQLELCVGEPRKNVVISTQVLLCPQDFLGNTAGKLLSQTEWTALEATLPSVGGRLINYPSIQVQMGLPGASVREVSKTTASGEWMGLQCPLQVEQFGELTRCYGTMEYRLQQGYTLEKNNLDRAPQQQFHSYPTEFDAFVPQGQTAVFSLDVPTLPGYMAYTCLRFKPQDDAIHSPKEPLGFRPD